LTDSEINRNVDLKKFIDEKDEIIEVPKEHY